MTEMTTRQKEIVEVAVKLIAQGGIQNLTMSNLARQIGVSEPAIYRHFESKMEILRAMLGQFKAHSEGLFAQARSLNGSEMHLLETIFLGRAKHFAANPHLAPVIFAEEAFRNEPRLAAEVFAIMTLAHETVAHIVTCAQAKGVIHANAPPEHLALMILGSLRLMVKRWHLSNYAFDLQAESVRVWESLKTVLAVKGENSMKMQRKIINIDETLCNGCGQCIPTCPEQAIQLVTTPDGLKARLVKEIFCDGLGACLGNCPTGALTITEREADAYDDAATVERIKAVAPELLETHRQHLAEHAAATIAPHGNLGCPSARMQQWDQSRGAAQPTVTPAAARPSELRQWPVQLHLVSPNAPYFKQADLVICADCVPFAYANFHQEFLKGDEKAIAVGCPKLDDTQAYLEKLTQMFTVAQPKTITIVNMEVPCCFGLVRLVQQALEYAAVEIPVKTVTISMRGDKLL